MIAGFLFIAAGLMGIFHPGFFYKTNLLSQQQIEQKKRIWVRSGIAFLIIGLTLLVMQFYWK